MPHDHTDDDTRAEDAERCRRLWRAVLHQQIQDAGIQPGKRGADPQSRTNRRYRRIKADARRFLKSPGYDEDVRYLCDLADIDYHAFRQAIAALIPDDTRPGYNRRTGQIAVYRPEDIIPSSCYRQQALFACG